MNPFSNPVDATPERQGSRADALERLVDRALRELPLRQAPATLESRVFDALERRAAQPWWRSDFGAWPMAARIALLIAAAGLAVLALRGTGALLAPLGSATGALGLPAEVAWVQALLTAMVSVLHHVPSLWIYGALATIGALYAALFGLSATAYRTLYATR